MIHNNLIEKLQLEIEKRPRDIRAEALLAVALKNGLATDDFSIAYDCFFYRDYGNDIYFSEIIEDAIKKKSLHLHLSRSGIYDQLPKGLFYKPDKTKNQVSSAATMVAEYKRNKQKEQEIRSFFMPFEEEAFRQRIQVEIEETRLLQGFQSGIFNDDFLRFWGISPLVQQSFAIPLMQLLPYAHTIAGNPDLTCRCLQMILNEQVTARIYSPWLTPTQQNIDGLGEQRLGIDMVSGWQFEEDHPVMEFTIGPLKNSAVTDYLQGGNTEEFLKTFYGFFVPAEAEVTTVIHVATQNKNMVLQLAEEPVLGYTSVL